MILLKEAEQKKSSEIFSKCGLDVTLGASGLKVTQSNSAEW
jgi:hypothetical protein